MYFSKGALGEIHGTLSVKGLAGTELFPLEKLVSTDKGVEGGDVLPVLFPNKPNPLKGEELVMALPLMSGLFLSGAVDAAVVGDFCRLTVAKEPIEKRLASDEPLEEAGCPPSAAAAGDVALTCRGCVSEAAALSLLPWKPRPAPLPRDGEGDADREWRWWSVSSCCCCCCADDDEAVDVIGAAARGEEILGLDEEEEGSGEEEGGGRGRVEERATPEVDCAVGEAAGEE